MLACTDVHVGAHVGLVARDGTGWAGLNWVGLGSGAILQKLAPLCACACAWSIIIFSHQVAYRLHTAIFLIGHGVGSTFTQSGLKTPPRCASCSCVLLLPE